jgi:hypothetical protein
MRGSTARSSRAGMVARTGINVRCSDVIRVIERTGRRCDRARVGG